MRLLENGYAAAAAVVTSGWLLRTLAPGLCASEIFGFEDALPRAVQLATSCNDASFLPIVAASLWSCKQAAEKGNLLSSATYERLNYLNIAYSVGGLLVAAAVGGAAASRVLGLHLVEALPATLVSAYALQQAGVDPAKALRTVGQVRGSSPRELHGGKSGSRARALARGRR